MSRQQGPLTVAAYAVHYVETLVRGSGPVPLLIQLMTAQVRIRDLSPRIEAFRDQLKAMRAHGLAWPVVRYMQREADGARQAFSPIDVVAGWEGASGIPRNLQDAGNARLLARNAESAVRRLGLQTDTVSPDDSEQRFSESVGAIIASRAGRSDPPDPTDPTAPPADEFEVRTNSDHVEIIHADGYFLTTARGFGVSTPARKRLVHGTYMFGWVDPVTRAQNFTGVLWSAPEDSPLPLKV